MYNIVLSNCTVSDRAAIRFALWVFISCRQMLEIVNDDEAKSGTPAASVSAVPKYWKGQLS